MNKWFELLLGLILVIGMILISYYSWAESGAGEWTVPGTSYSLDFLHAAWIFFKGGIFWFVIMVGLLLILLGISDLKE
jgi:ABC-type Fe3+ transport system permease subunit